MKTNLKRKNKTLSTKNIQREETTNFNLSYIAAKAALEKKGENILLLDVSKLTCIADYFLIVTAKSTPQIEAIAKYTEEKLNDLNLKLISREGFIGSNWTVLDFGNLVVHIMTERERNYYKLEKFWSNGTLIENKLWEKAS